MKKEIASKLSLKAKEVASKFSRTDRQGNFNSETFSVHDIKPLSEYTACVYFLKNTGKQGVAFFYYINQGDGYWQYFFPSDSHILGMEKFGELKMKVEFDNWGKNEESLFK